MKNEKIQSLLEQYNLQGQDKVKEVKEALEKVAQKTLAKRQQHGGRIVLPSEYFGNDSGRYGAVEAPINMSATTDALARAALLAHEPAPMQSGGSRKLHQKVFSQADIKELAQKAKLQLRSKNLREATNAVTQQVDVYLQAVSSLVKNAERKLGKVHLQQALRGF